MLAHQGGWDEMLMVAAPILLFWLILRLARRRAERFDASLDEPFSGSTASDSDAVDPEKR